MLQIDFGLMFCAISSNERYGWLDEKDGFLNRQTGEIVFVWRDHQDAIDGEGPDGAIESYLARKAIDAAPDVWIEIPRYDPREDGRDQQEEFCRAFLAKHRIEAVLVF